MIRLKALPGIVRERFYHFSAQGVRMVTITS